MAAMTDAEAKAIIEAMFDTAINDVVSFRVRIKELEDDFNADPHPLTEHQITRTKARLEKRIKEGAALAIAATKF